LGMTIDDLIAVVLIEGVSNAERLTATGMNTAGEYTAHTVMGTELPFMPRRPLSMDHHRRRRASVFFFHLSLFAEERKARIECL
jgi:hypothetical protein